MWRPNIVKMMPSSIMAVVMLRPQITLELSLEQRQIGNYSQKSEILGLRAILAKSETREIKEINDYKGSKENRESKENKENKANNEKKGIKESKENNEKKGIKANKENREKLDQLDLELLLDDQKTKF